MPNLASSYHAGERYCCSDVQSLRKRPWLTPLATRSRIALRCGANLALACCQAASCAAGDSVSAVGAVADCAMANPQISQPAMREAHASIRPRALPGVALSEKKITAGHQLFQFTP